VNEGNLLTPQLLDSSTSRRLFDRNALCQVPRFVNVAAAQQRAVIRKKLQGNDGKDRHQKFVVLGNLDKVIHREPSFALPVVVTATMRPSRARISCMLEITFS